MTSAGSDAPGVRPTWKTPNWKVSLTICWNAGTAIPSGWLASTAEGWSRDVTQDVARELRQRCADQERELPEFLHEFVERYVGPNESVQLPLPVRS